MIKLLWRMCLCVCILCLSGCGGRDESVLDQKVVVTDSIGREVEVALPLTRVAVANAYNTEMINAIDAIDAVVGVDYAIYRDQEAYQGRFSEENIIGKDQRELNYEHIIKLAPQAVILTGNGSWEEAEKKLAPFGIQVIVLDAYYTNQFFDNIMLAGLLFGKEKEAMECSAFFKEKLDYIRDRLEGVERKSIYYEYRREGNSTVPGDYFYYMVKYAGGDNIFEDAQNVNVDSESIILRNPQYIVKVGETNIGASYLPPTEAEFVRRKEEIRNRSGWGGIDAVKDDNILLLSHYCHGGASKLIGTMYIAKFMYPELLPDLEPEEVFRVWLEKYQKLDYLPGHTYPAYHLQGGPE